MYPYIHITLPSYGVLAFIGGVVAIVYLFFRIDRYNIEFADFLKLYIIAVMGGFIGSKLLFALTQTPWLIDNFSMSNLLLLIPRSGYVYYGGLFGAMLALLLAIGNKDKRVRVFRMIIPAIPLFHGFGRIGCMMAGCCYGVELNKSIQLCFLKFNRFPVQLVESGYEFSMFILFTLLEKMGSKLYSLDNYVMLYAFFRFFIEFLRGDEVRGIWVIGLSTSQIVSVLIIVVVFSNKMYQKVKAMLGYNKTNIKST